MAHIDVKDPKPILAYGCESIYGREVMFVLKGCALEEPDVERECQPLVAEFGYLGKVVGIIVIVIIQKKGRSERTALRLLGVF